MQSEEPTTSLVHALVDEVGRECLLLVNELMVLERIVNLSVRHRTRVEPNINQIALTLHRLTRFRNQHDIIYIRTVQINLVVVLLRHIARHKALLLQRVACHYASSHCLLYLVVEFLYASDAHLLAILTTPDRQWSTPET